MWRFIQVLAVVNPGRTACVLVADARALVREAHGGAIVEYRDNRLGEVGVDEVLRHLTYDGVRNVTPPLPGQLVHSGGERLDVLADIAGGHLFNTRGRPGCFIYGHARASRYRKRGARRIQACRIATLGPRIVEGLHLPPAFHNPGQSTAQSTGCGLLRPQLHPENCAPRPAAFPTPNGGSPSTTSPFQDHPQEFPHCGETPHAASSIQHDTPARGRCIHQPPSTSLWKPLARNPRNPRRHLESNRRTTSSGSWPASRPMGERVSQGDKRSNNGDERLISRMLRKKANPLKWGR